MKRVENTVFMSYRRKDISWADAIHGNLKHHGYDVFFDYESIGAGNFEQIILENIRTRAHFIVLLTPSALDRCNEPGDWLRREIETALAAEKNIVPIFLEGFSFTSPNVETHLTGELKKFAQHNGIAVPNGYFEEAMDKLRENFLAGKDVSPGQGRIKIILNPSMPTILSNELLKSRLQTLMLDGVQIPFNYSEFVTATANRQAEVFNEMMNAGPHEIVIGQSPATVERASQKFSVSDGQTATVTLYPVKVNDPGFPTSMFKVIRWKISVRIEPSSK